MSLTQNDLEKLKQPFPDDVIGVKVQSFSKARDKAMLILYVQHTDVYDRLEMVDPAWQFAAVGYERSGDTVIVHGKLTVKGVSRENAGEGDDYKSAYSDSLKRCSMLFGVGRYLYDAEQVWVPYNEQNDRFKRWTIAEYRANTRQRPSPSTNAALKPTPQASTASKQFAATVVPGNKTITQNVSRDKSPLPSSTDDDNEDFFRDRF